MTDPRHGDLGGRNVIGRHVADSRWDVAGPLDWESPAIGSFARDVGSLFRYPHRYSRGFGDAFAIAYKEAGHSLPDEWWRLSRLVDATHLVSTLAEDRACLLSSMSVGG